MMMMMMMILITFRSHVYNGLHFLSTYDGADDDDDVWVEFAKYFFHKKKLSYYGK
jgi:hypothetical protein